MPLAWLSSKPEYRGSTGYGTAHMAAIYQHFGDRAYRDVDSAADFAIAQGWAEQTHRYKAAIEGAGMTDWLSFIPASDTWLTDYDAHCRRRTRAPC